MIWRSSAGRRCAPALLFLSLCAVASAAEPNQNHTPILLELFTSEGCSSCPPVDNWAARLDQFQPVARGQVILLSEHVDYWDHDGWKDPFSSASLTQRQREYSRELGLTDVYTPQVIVNGDVELHPWKPDEVRASLNKAATEPAVALRIEGVSIQDGTLTGKVEAYNSNKHGDVFVALALDKTLTDVLAGENNGKKLTNIAVVKDLIKVGKLEKGRSLDQPFSVKLWPDADPANLRVVAFVQESGPGKVLGAAMTKQIARGQ